MKKIAILYGSTTDNTKAIAEKIAEKLSNEEVTLFDVSKVDINQLAEYPNLILGSSTWGMGDLQDDWEEFLPKFKDMDLAGKTIALFGLGDCETYSDTFVDAMGIIYESIKDKSCNLIGEVSTIDYNFDNSVSAIEGKFVGLAIDEDNESDKTNDRINKWIEEINLKFI